MEELKSIETKLRDWVGQMEMLVQPCQNNLLIYSNPT